MDMHLSNPVVERPAATVQALKVLGNLELVLRNTDAELERIVANRHTQQKTTTGMPVRESIPNPTFPTAFRSYASAAREAAALLMDTSLPSREFLSRRLEHHGHVLDANADVLQSMVSAGRSFGSSWSTILDGVITDAERAVTALLAHGAG
jgi:hypothetical protein